MSAEPACPVPDMTVAAVAAPLPKKVIIGTKNAYKFGYEYEYSLAQVGVGPDFVYTLNKKEDQDDLCIKKEGGHWVVYEYTLEPDGSGGLLAGKPRFRTAEDMAVAGDHTWEMYDEKKEDWFGSLLCRTEIE